MKKKRVKAKAPVSPNKAGPTPVKDKDVAAPVMGAPMATMVPPPPVALMSVMPPAPLTKAVPRTSAKTPPLPENPALPPRCAAEPAPPPTSALAPPATPASAALSAVVAPTMAAMAPTPAMASALSSPSAPAPPAAIPPATTTPATPAGTAGPPMTTMAMATMSIPPPQGALAFAGPPTYAELIQEWLKGKAATTLLAYRGDLEDFASFLGVQSIDDSAKALLSGGHGAANRIILTYKNSLMERAPRNSTKKNTPDPDLAAKAPSLSTATVARRLAAVRSLVRLARLLGLIDWSIDVSSPRVERVKDVRGPRLEDVRELKKHLESHAAAKGLRDVALLRLMFDLALRRAEVCELDLAHVDLVAGTVSIRGKGRAGRETLTLPQPTRAALAAWIEARGTAPGPIFITFDKKRPTSARLTPRGLYFVINQAGKSVGLKARPHGLRHASISTALDAFNGDVRKTAAHSRHRDWRTLSDYYDRWKDEAGEVARKVADALAEPPNEKPPHANDTLTEAPSSKLA